MGIFAIQYKENVVHERVVRLYNTKSGGIKDIKESDLLFLDGNIAIQNAKFENGKLKGTTGSLAKVLNKEFVIIIGSINKGNEIVGYKVVNGQGKSKDFSVPETISLFNNYIVQNASLVDGKHIRGINWKIPSIEDITEKKLPPHVEDNMIVPENVLKKIKPAHQTGVVLLTDHFEMKRSFIIKDRTLELHLTNFYLRTSPDIFYDVVEDLAKTNARVRVNREKYIIFVSNLTSNLSTDIDAIKQICKELGATLALQCLSKVKFRLENIVAQSSVEELYLDWGATFMYNPSEYCRSTFKGLDLRYIMTKDDNYFNKSFRSLGYLTHWNDELGHLYQEYMKALCKEKDIICLVDTVYLPVVYEGTPNNRLKLTVKNGVLVFSRNTELLDMNGINKEGVIVGDFKNPSYRTCEFLPEQKTYTMFCEGGDVDLRMNRDIFFKFYDYYVNAKSKFEDFGTLAFSGSSAGFSVSFVKAKFNFRRLLEVLNDVCISSNCKLSLDISEIGYEFRYTWCGMDVSADEQYQMHDMFGFWPGDVMVMSLLFCNVVPTMVKEWNIHSNIELYGDNEVSEVPNVKSSLVERDTICYGISIRCKPDNKM